MARAERVAAAIAESGDALSPENQTKLRMVLIRQRGTWEEWLGAQFGRWPGWCASAAAQLTAEALAGLTAEALDRRRQRERVRG